MQPTRKKNTTKHTAPQSKAKTTAPVSELTSARPSAEVTLAGPTMKPKTATYEARMRQLAPIVRLRRKLEATAKRFSNVAREVKRWTNAPELAEKAASVEVTIATLVADAAALPDTFVPER